MDLPSARESIFVSHVNGDAAAEKVLARLTEKLCDALGAGHASYKIVWDRQSIFPSDDWRDRIFQWLWDCPAAVILVSLDAFLSSKPWVSSETFFLSVRRKQADASGGTVIIVPVVIGTAIEKLTTTQTFEPSNLREIAYIHCDDPSDEAALDDVVRQVAQVLSSKLPPVRGGPVVGLPKAIAEVLRHYPETLGPIADVLRLGALRTADEVSDQLYAADRAAVMDALEAFWRSANQAAPIEQKIRALRRLRDLLNAREVSEAAARALAAEMTRPPEEARAVVLDSWRDDITSLYVKRALGTADHRWKLLPAISVLELGTVDSARQELEGVLLKEFALGVDDPEDARAQCHRGAAIRRAAGRPVVVCLNIADDADCGPLAAAAREAAPNCGLLLRTKKALPPDDRCRSMMVHRLEPPLAGNGLLSIIEMIAALNSVCEDLINQ